MPHILFANESKFAIWSKSLDADSQRALLATLKFVAEVRRVSDLPSKLSKSLRSNISELRIGKNLKEALRVANEMKMLPVNGHNSRVLLRVFYLELREDLILVLSGYNKLVDPSRERQQSEIENSFKVMQNWLLNNDVF